MATGNKLKRVTVIGAVAAAAAGVSVIGPVASAATAPTCQTRDFRIQQVNAQGALGTYLVGIAYRNITQSTCTTSGFPGVTLYSHGSKLVVATRQRNAHFSALQVRPGRQVFGVVSYLHFPSPGHGCRAVTGLGVYAPNSTQFVRFSIPQGDVYCSGAAVYPLATSVRSSVLGP
jgi:Protein of unknown function (DUF4232)